MIPYRESIRGVLGFLNSATLQSLVSFIIVYVILTFIGLVAYFFFVYPLVHGSFQVGKTVMNSIRPFRRLYYYEFDIRIDQPISLPRVKSLLEYQRTLLRSDFGKAKPVIVQIDKNAYRVEVENLEEGDYKLHYTARVLWPRTLFSPRFYGRYFSELWRWPIMRAPIISQIFMWLKLTYIEMSADVTYELFHHQPSGVDSFVLREFRLMTTHAQRLETNQLKDFQGTLSANL